MSYFIISNSSSEYIKLPPLGLIITTILYFDDNLIVPYDGVVPP